MVLFSTRESIHGDQISLLALAETLIAIGISLFLYFHFRFVNHILISAAIAPFLLLRTPRISDQSINIGEDVLNKIVVYFNKFENSLAIPFIIFLYVIAVVALSFAIKATVILYNTVLHPIEAIGAVPSNWRRIVLCADTASAPELIPGIDDRKDLKGPAQIFSLGTIAKDLWDQDFWMRGVSIIILIILYIPAVMYRWSLKATALVWSPLVWAFRPIKEAENTFQFAKDIVTLPVYKPGRVLAYFVIVMSLVKCVLWFSWIYLGSQLHGWVAVVLTSYLVPEGIAVWHITAFINSILTLVIFHAARGFLQHPDRFSKGEITLIFKVSFILRNILSIYTSLCTLYITYTLVSRIEIPPLRLIFVPW